MRWNWVKYELKLSQFRRNSTYWKSSWSNFKPLFSGFLTWSKMEIDRRCYELLLRFAYAELNLKIFTHAMMGGNFMQRGGEISLPHFPVMNGMCVTIKWLWEGFFSPFKWLGINFQERSIPIVVRLKGENSWQYTNF